MMWGWQRERERGSGEGRENDMEMEGVGEVRLEGRRNRGDEGTDGRRLDDQGGTWRKT